ncbi:MULTISPECIES: ankyrin repeat domain-containing protein [Streptomyces]|uniref:ankyrin repeat domain-containing protein n=1 Tax=Streptomyces TaxID=1883 RepID=UPI0016789EE8|nr:MULTISPECIES: ankyrin repeat domain-containing protein [Streptomyces]MBD3575861.1 ankyrin repeat domain-containing protein [Streptomyces sp. KD18]GGS82288.1 hypothetical protein GCM10010286_03640 [Streptomyces toxytricini]
MNAGPRRPATDPRLPGGLRHEDGPVWQRIRRHAVPARMIEDATARRLAGDWRAACAAAAVDVRFDLSEVAARHGAAVAEAAEDDLLHLAPDLVRWHLPRLLGGRTTLTPNVRVLLARYGGGPGAPVLSATTGPMADGPQRLRLHCAPLHPADANRSTHHTAPSYRHENWIAARPLWDARQAAGLRDRLTGGAGRLPFLHPDGTPLDPAAFPAADPGAGDPAAHAEWTALLHARGDAPAAYAAAGLERDTAPSETGPQQGRVDPDAVLAAGGVDLTRLEQEVRRLADAGEGGRFTVPTGWYGLLVLRLSGDRGLRVSGERRQWHASAASGPRLPAFAYERLPDLELVRTGRITPRELHPLVASSLFPDAGPADGPPGPAEPRPVRVRCRTSWHEVHSRGGTLDLLHHSAEEQRRESAMRAFGGAVTGCFAVQHAWTAPDGVRLPRALREERRELFLRVQHGDTAGVTALLDAGTDPRVRDGRGCTLLHLLPQLDHSALLPRLLGAGLSPEVRDGLGRTPLVTAVTNGGSADLVRALVAAGSRIDATDEADLSLAQIIRRFRRTDLGFLRSRVEEEFPGIGADWFDDWIEEQEEYAETDDDADAGPDAGAEEDDSA